MNSLHDPESFRDIGNPYSDLAIDLNLQNLQEVRHHQREEIISRSRKSSFYSIGSSGLSDAFSDPEYPLMLGDEGLPSFNPLMLEQYIYECGYNNKLKFKRDNGSNFFNEPLARNDIYFEDIVYPLLE